VTTSKPDEVAAAMSDPKGTHKQKKAAMSDPKGTHKQKKAETHALPEKAMCGTTETHVLPEKAMSGTSDTKPQELEEAAENTETHALPEKAVSSEMPPEQKTKKRKKETSVPTRRSMRIQGQAATGGDSSGAQGKDSAGAQAMDSASAHAMDSVASMQNPVNALVVDPDLPIKNTRSDLPLSGHDPRTYRQAMACDLRKQWQEAMRQEYASLIKNNRFTLVSEANSQPIGCKWVYKTKQNPNGTIRYKARLVIKGYEQVEGINFDETYAPVGTKSTLRYLLSFVARNESKIDHLDVVTAFLNPEIDAEVYMQQPDGIDWLEPTTSELSILHLNKALYSLRQAPHLWHKASDGFLISIGFVRSNAHQNFYIRSDGVLLLLYADDMLVAYADGSSERAIDVKNALMKQYQMSNLGLAKRFLGLDITRLPDGSTFLSQQSYIDSVVKRFGIRCKFSSHTIIP